MHTAARLLLCALVGIVAGCEEPTTSSISTATAPPPPPTPGGPPSPPPPQPQSFPAEPQTAPGPQDYESEVADVGVGKQGRNYGGGIVSEPIRQYFRVGQQIQFLQMERAMRTFKTLHERNPNSHEEFMKEIIEASQIALPELPAGEKYRYDPQSGELMVDKPSR